jgi:hypothetical protein
MRVSTRRMGVRESINTTAWKRRVAPGETFAEEGFSGNVETAIPENGTHNVRLSATDWRESVMRRWLFRWKVV